MFGLYLHIPFCQHKCSYCDFYSIERFDQRAHYVDALIKEIEMRADMHANSLPDVSSVFFGGGTPSLLSPEEILRICERLRSLFRISESAEWTMECNPGTVDVQSLAGYRDAGVNRLSFGVQSFHAHELQFLERIHDAEEAQKAVEMALAAGFRNINVDLMFALPGQTLEQFQYSVQRACALPIQHISAYSLIYEEGTPMYARYIRNELDVVGEEQDTAMYQWAISYLRERGFAQYEVSNFAKDGAECQHNLCYWQGEQYLAFGPSAHGFVATTRYWNPRSLQSYLQRIAQHQLPTLSSETLSQHDCMFERCFLELRAKGIRLMEFERDFAVNLSELLQSELPWLQTEGFVVLSDRLQLSAKGYSVCDDVSLKLIQALEHRVSATWRHIEAPEETDVVTITL